MAIRLYVRMVTSFSFSPYHHKAFAPVLLVLLLLILRPNVWILIKTAGPNRYSSCHKLLLFLLFIPYFLILFIARSLFCFLSFSFFSQPIQMYSSSPVLWTKNIHAMLHWDSAKKQKTKKHQQQLITFLLNIQKLFSSNCAVSLLHLVSINIEKI